jgi:hypothetical protein
MTAVQKQLDEAGITVLGGQEAVKEIGNLKQAPSQKHEYGNRTLTLEIVRSLDEAVDHIHSFGSGHTEAIITGKAASMPCLLTFTTPHSFFANSDCTGLQKNAAIASWSYTGPRSSRPIAWAGVSRSVSIEHGRWS